MLQHKPVHKITALLQGNVSSSLMLVPENLKITDTNPHHINNSYSVHQQSRQHNQYRNLLQAGWSWARTPVETRLSTPFQTGHSAHPASCAMGTGSLSWDESSQRVGLTTHTLLVGRMCSDTSVAHLCVHNMLQDGIYLLLYTPNFMVLQTFQLLRIRPSGLS